VFAGALDGAPDGAAVSTSDVLTSVGAGAAAPSRASMLEAFVQHARVTWATRLAGEAVGEFIRDDGGGADDGGARSGAAGSDDGEEDANEEWGRGRGNDAMRRRACGGAVGHSDRALEESDDDESSGSGSSGSSDDEGGGAPVRTLSCAACFAELARGGDFAIDAKDAGPRAQYVLTLLSLPPSLRADEFRVRERAADLGVHGRESGEMLLPLGCAACGADVGARETRGRSDVSLITQGVLNGLAL
jgi:hypothetical protein